MVVQGRHDRLAFETLEELARVAAKKFWRCACSRPSDWLEPAEWFDSRRPSKTAKWLGVPRRAISRLNSRLGRYEDHTRLDFARVDDQPDVHFPHKRGFMCKTGATEPARSRELMAAA